MGLFWWEFVLIAAMFAGTLGVSGLIVVKGWLPGKQKQLQEQVQEWAGGAIGTFWNTIMEKAADEEGAEGSSPGSGVVKLGGFQIDMGTIKGLMEIAPQLIQLAQMFGLVKGGGGGGGGFNVPGVPK